MGEWEDGKVEEDVRVSEWRDLYFLLCPLCDSSKCAGWATERMNAQGHRHALMNRVKDLCWVLRGIHPYRSVLCKLMKTIREMSRSHTVDINAVSVQLCLAE